MKNNADNIFKAIKQIVTEKTGVEPEEIEEGSYFEGDLNIGEFEMVEILSELEELFNVELIAIKDEVDTVQSLIDLINEQIE